MVLSLVSILYLGIPRGREEGGHTIVRVSVVAFVPDYLAVLFWYTLTQSKDNTKVRGSSDSGSFTSGPHGTIMVLPETKTVIS